MMTYSEIYNKFLKSTKIDRDLISDYRPCIPLFAPTEIDNAIIVWLKDGSRIIYIGECFL